MHIFRLTNKIRALNIDNPALLQRQGRIQTMWKLWFTMVKFSYLHKIGKYKEIGENSGNYQQNREKSETSHM